MQLITRIMQLITYPIHATDSQNDCFFSRHPCRTIFGVDLSRPLSATSDVMPSPLFELWEGFLYLKIEKLILFSAN